VPVVVWSAHIQDLLGYQAPAFPGSEWIGPVLATVIFLYGGLVFLQGAWRELKDRLPGMMTLISLARRTCPNRLHLPNYQKMREFRMRRLVLAVAAAITFLVSVAAKPSDAATLEIDDSNFAYFILDNPSWEQNFPFRANLLASNCAPGTRPFCVTTRLLVSRSFGLLQSLGGPGDFNGNMNGLADYGFSLEGGINWSYPDDFTDITSFVIKVAAGKGTHVSASVEMGLINNQFSFIELFDVRAEVHPRNDIPRYLAAVPLPATAPILALGLAGLVLFRRRRS